MNDEKKLREASVAKLLLTMSLPVILVMTMNVIYNVADVFFIGRTGDTVQVAAVSLAGPVFTAISALNTLIGFGGCTAISIVLGTQNADPSHSLEEGFRESRKYSAFVVYSSLFLGAVILIALLARMSALLPLLGTDAQTAPYTRDYLTVLAIGAPWMLVGGAMGNTIRADGDTKNAVIGAISGNLVNILLDPILISVLHMGARGAAIATVAGNLVSCVWMLYAAHKKPAFSLSIRDFTLKKEVSLRVLSLGIPMAVGTLLMSFAGAFGNNLMARYGSTAIAARAVGGKVGMIVPMVIMGVCMGIQPAISYAYGMKLRTGDGSRLKAIVKGTGICSVLTGTILSLILFLFREQLVSAFITDPAVLPLGKTMLIGAIIVQPVYGIYQLSSTYLQAIGRVPEATVTSLLRQGIVYIPVLYGMEALFGLTGLVYSSAVTDVISTVVALVIVSCMKKTSSKAGREASLSDRIAA